MKTHHFCMKVVAGSLLVSFSFTNSVGYSDISSVVFSGQATLTREKASNNAVGFHDFMREQLERVGYSLPKRVRLNPFSRTSRPAKIIDRTDTSRLSISSKLPTSAAVQKLRSRHIKSLNVVRFLPVAFSGPVAYSVVTHRSELRSDIPEKITKVAVMGAGIIAKGIITSAISVGGVDVYFASRHPDRVRSAMDPKHKDSVIASMDASAQVVSGLRELEKRRKTPGISADEMAGLNAQIAEKTQSKSTLLADWTGKLHGFSGDTLRDLVSKLLDQDPEIFIESISEDALDKQALFKALVEEVEKRRAAGKIISLRAIATTTSSLKVDELAKDLPTEWQNRIVGFHPFNPVPLMKLVEIVATNQTRPEVIQLAENLAKQMGKTSVRVKDSPGFIVNRVLYAYLNEALRLLRRGEGSFKQIVAAAKEFGMPLDPFELLDLIGHDTNFEIMNNLHKGLPIYSKPDPLIEEFRSLGRSGRKAKKGFYNYANGRPEEDLDISQLFAQLNTEKGWNIKYDQEVTAFDKNRLLYVLTNEAARIAEEGTASIPDIELAMMLGTGFPEKLGGGIKFDGGVFALTATDIDYLKVTPEEKAAALAEYIKAAKKAGTYRSGPFGWAIRFGIEKIVDDLEVLSQIYGQEYKPAHLLEQLRMGRLPERDASGHFEPQPYVRVWVKPREMQGPFTTVAQEAIIASQPIIEGHQIRLRTILADINANGGWLGRNYPINTARLHKDTATVTGSAGLMLVTEVGRDIARHKVLKVGQLVIMLSGTHELLTLDSMGESAQAIPSFRITGYEAKIAQEGNFGQETVLNFQDVVPVSQGVYQFDELGPVGLVWPTAWHALNVLGLREGQTILVEGGSGGTGEAGVKIARDRGAHVISTVSDAVGESIARENGAQTIIYRTEVPDEESYVRSVRIGVNQLTGQNRGVDKVVFSSGQALAPWHWEALREGDPDNPDDLGGQGAFFGAGATGFAHDHFGTKDSAKVGTMLRRVQHIRTNRYHVSKNIDRVLIAGSDERAHEATLEAKRRGASVILLARSDEEEARIRAWKFNQRPLQFTKTWVGTKEPDGIIRIDKIAPLERMPDFPKLLPNQPTAEQVSKFTADQAVFGEYMKGFVIPFAKAITKIWGETVDERTGEKTPKSAHVAWIFWDGADGENIVNPFTFVGFFTQIVFPNDTSKMHIRYHAANLWMRQNSLIFTRKVMFGVHYASPAESKSVIERIMRGDLTPRAARLFSWEDLPLAVEGQGRGKNNILVSVPRGNYKTLDEAYANQTREDAIREINLSLRIIDHIANTGPDIEHEGEIYNILMDAIVMVGSSKSAEMAEALGLSHGSSEVNDLDRWLNMFRNLPTPRGDDSVDFTTVDEISRQRFLEAVGGDTGRPNLDLDRWMNRFRETKTPRYADVKARADKAGEAAAHDYFMEMDAAPRTMSSELTAWLKRSELRIATAAVVVSKDDIAQNRGWYGPESDPAIMEIDRDLYEREIGEPGKAPHVRGIQPNMYVRRLGGQVPTNRKYGSFGTWREARKVIAGQLEQGVRGLSIAYDLLTQLGIDPDDVRGAGEVGKNGVSIASLRDYEQLFTPELLKEIVDKKIGVSKTINATSAILFAMYVAAAKKAGIDPKLLRGTIQNDILKEYRARNNFAFPLGGALRLIRDIFSWSKENVPSFNTISISGYHDREKGASASGELLAMFSSAIEYLVVAEEGALDVADVAKQISFFMNVKMNVMEEAAKFRAARRIWVKILKEGFGVTDPRALQFRVQGYAGGTDLQYQKPHVNIVRDGVRAITAVSSSLAGVNAPSFDEAHGIPTALSETVSIDTNYIAIEETGLSEVVDPFGGSYYLEAKALDLEKDVWQELAGFSKAGNFQTVLSILRGSSEDGSMQENGAIESGRQKIVGRNILWEGAELAPKIEQNKESSQDYRPAQLAALEELKRTRDDVLVTAKLAALERVAKNSKENLMPAILEAVEAYATVGEIIKVLKTVFGESDREDPWEPSATVPVFNERLNGILAKLAVEAKSGNSAEIEKRGYALPIDLPWVKSINQYVVERPGEFPFTRGTKKKSDFIAGKLINGAQMSESGATAEEELTWSLVEAIRYVEKSSEGVDRINAAKRVTFILSASSNFVETVSKFRAARLLWAKLLRERFMIQDEDALQLRTVAVTDRTSYATKKPWNNIVRGTQQALAAKMGGANEITVTKFDQPYGNRVRWSKEPEIDSDGKWSEQLAEDTVGVIEYEAGLDQVKDPLAGSYAVEALTHRLYAEVHSDVTTYLIAGFNSKPESFDYSARQNAEKIAGLRPVVGVTIYKEGTDRQPVEGIAATESQSVTASMLEKLRSADEEERASAVRHLALAGDLLVSEVLRNPVFAEHTVRVDAQTLPHIGSATVASAGLAVTSEHFNQIRSLFGNPDLSKVPAGVGVDEFEITVTLSETERMFDGRHRILDILRDAPDSEKKTIEGFIKRSGEGIQQIEIWTPDIQAAAKAIVAASANKMSGIAKVDEAPREGANGTTVFFSLVTVTGGKKVLVELVQLPRSELRAALAPKSVAVIGAGTMGVGIAQATIQHGINTALSDVGYDQLQRARKIINGSLEKAKTKGKLTEEPDDILSRLTLLWDNVYNEFVFSSNDLIIEAILENVTAKQNLFRKLDKSAKPDAILATNTTTIPIETLAEAVSPARRKNIVGIHFQNPAHVNPLVEIVVGNETSQETVDRAKAYVTALGKKAIVVKSQPGFVTSRLIIPLINLAVKILEGSKGIPTELGISNSGALDHQGAAIEEGFKAALGSKLGAFELIKLIGSTVVLNAQRLLHQFLPNDLYQPEESLSTDAEASYLSPAPFQYDQAVQIATNFFIGAAVLVASQLIDEQVILGVNTEDEARGTIDEAVRSGFGWKNGIFAQIESVGAENLEHFVTAIAQWYSIPVPESFTRWIASRRSELRMADQPASDNTWVDAFLAAADDRDDDTKIDRDDPRNVGAAPELTVPPVFNLTALPDSILDGGHSATDGDNASSELRSIQGFLAEMFSEDKNRSIVMVVGDNEQRLTYGDLDIRSNQVANTLINRGISKGARVGVFLPNSPVEMIVDIGIWKAGTVRVPLRQGWTEKEIVEALKKTGAQAAFVPKNLYPVLRREFPLMLIFSSTIESNPENPENIEDALGRIFSGVSKESPRVEVKSSDLAQLVFSSGTSGESKIVMQTHANFAATIQQIAEWMKEVEPGAAVNSLPPGTFGTHVAFASLLSGRELILAPRIPTQTREQYVASLANVLKNSKVRVLFGVPTTFYDLAQTGEKFPGLIGLSRGSALGNVKESFESKTGARVIEGYGLSEATSSITNPVKADKPGTVGKPNPGVSVKIINPKTPRSPYQPKLISAGEVGELVIKGPQVMQGYWNESAPEVAFTEDGFVRTGDLAKVDEDGYVTIVGRTKDIIITGGENVIPGEVEDVIRNRGGIQDVAVVGISDPNYFGEDPEFTNLVSRFGEVVVAFVVPERGAAIAANEDQNIITNAKKSLATFKVPKRVIFVNELPLTGDLEKVDRNVLKRENPLSVVLVKSELRRVSLDEINPDFKTKLLVAFGGNQTDAESDLNYRLENMRAIRSDVSADAAAARLVWEYMPREIQNVFPGDNWKFLLLNTKRPTQAQIEDPDPKKNMKWLADAQPNLILLLDLEDAVSTLKKEVGREVLILLVRAFRGEILSEQEFNFLLENATGAKDEKDPMTNYFDKVEPMEMLEGGYQLKKEFHFHPNQMVLFRPNNLRTKWAAKDYAYVFRKIGHLIDGFYMPKTFGPEDVRIGASIARAIQKEQAEKTKDLGWTLGKHRIFDLTELPGSVLTAKRILSIAPEIEEAQLGVVDYTAATGGKNQVQIDQVPYMRSAILGIVEAARETGKSAGMGITVTLAEDPTRVETGQVIQLGMNRKWSVHPPSHIKAKADFIGQFPPIIRKFLDYKDLDKLTFDLKKLDEMAEAGTPILPPQVFVPREVIPTRSVIEIEHYDMEGFRKALESSTDTIVIDIAHLKTTAAAHAHGIYNFFASQPNFNKTILLRTSDDSDKLRNWLKVWKKGIHGIVQQNVQNASQIRMLDAILSDIEQDLNLPAGTYKVSADFQSKEVIDREANAFEELEHESILRASSRVESAFLNLKRDDLVVEAPDDPTTKSYNYYHSLFIAMTAYAQIDAIDGYSQTTVNEDTERAANWGFVGKLVTSDQVGQVNELMNPIRAGEMPEFDLKTEDGKKAKSEWLKTTEGKKYAKAWKNSMERDLLIIELYANADQDRGLGAVGYRDPITGNNEIVDAASARIPFKQLERALKLNLLTDAENARYEVARARLLLALRPGGRTEDTGTTVFAGQRFIGTAIRVTEDDVKIFAKDGDRNRFHLDSEYAKAGKFGVQVGHGFLTVTLALASALNQLAGYRLAPKNGIKKGTFLAPVKFDDVIVPIVDILESKPEGVSARIRIVNQDGKVVSEVLAIFVPQIKTEARSLSAEANQIRPFILGTRIFTWASDVKPHVPDSIPDFTDAKIPRTHSQTVQISEEIMLSGEVLTRSTGEEFVAQATAVKLIARESAEAVPGHVLLGFSDVSFNAPIKIGDTITLKATVPAADQIQLTKDGLAKVPVMFTLTNQDGQIVATASAMKLAEKKSEPAKAGEKKAVEMPVPIGAPQSGDFLLYGRSNITKGTLQYPEDLTSHEETATFAGAIEDFFKKEIVPQGEKIDSGKVKVEDGIRKKLGELGLLGLVVDPEYGGVGASKLVKTLADKWAWYANPSVGSIVRVHGGVGTLPIVKFGTEDQKRKYLPKLASGEWIGAYALTEEAHGSDSLSRDTVLRTAAILKKDDTNDEEYYELNGSKAFITNGRFGDLFIVFAMSGPNEKSVFLVERTFPGVSTGNDYEKTGLHGSSTVDLFLENVRVPKTNLLGRLGQGEEIGFAILNHGRTAVAAGSWGGVERVFGRTLNWAIERKQFGVPLANKGAVQETLADMEVIQYALESISFGLAGLFDGGLSEPGIEASAAKVWGSEALNKVTAEGVQKRGGAGFITEEAIARIHQDARVMTIFEGANEILDSQVIAPQVLKFLQTQIWKKGFTLLQGWNVPASSPLEAQTKAVKQVAGTIEHAAKILVDIGGSKAMKENETLQSYFMAFGKSIAELFAVVSTINRTQHRIDSGLESAHQIDLSKILVTEAIERIEKQVSRILKPSEIKHVDVDKSDLLDLKHKVAQKTLEATGKWQRPSRSELRMDVPVTNGQAENIRTSVGAVLAAFNSNEGARSELRKTLGIDSKDAQAFVAFGRAAAFDEGGATFAAALANFGETVAVVAPSRSELRLISEMNDTLPKGRQIYAASTPADAAHFLEAQMRRRQARSELRSTGVRVYFATSVLEAEMISEQGGFDVISIMKRTTFAALENAMTRVSEALGIFIKTVQAIYQSA